MVLNYYLLTNLKVFQETVSAWPASLYDVKNIINVVLEKLKKETNAPELMLTLAELYEKDGQYSKALHIYLRLRRGDVFSLIEKYNLFSYIQDKIVLLMEFDPQQAVTMLVKNVDKIDIGNVTEQLKAHPFLLHQYLDTLFNKDPHVGADYHILQVCEGKESVWVCEEECLSFQTSTYYFFFFPLSFFLFYPFYIFLSFPFFFFSN